MTEFIRYQYKNLPNLLNLDHLIRVVAWQDETDTFTLHIYTTTDDWYMHDEEAEALWNKLVDQQHIAIEPVWHPEADVQS